MGAGAGGTLVGDSTAVGAEAGGDARSFGGAGGGEVGSDGGFLSSGVDGPERMGGATGSSVGGGEVGRGGSGSSFGGGEVGRGGAGSSGRGGDVGKGGAGDSGGGGEAGRGGAGSSGRGGRAADSSLKQTHESFFSSPAGGASSGPKMLSRSAIEGFLAELSASVDTSASSAGLFDGGEVGTFFGGRGGGVPVGKDLDKEESGSDRGAPHASDSDRTTSVFGSPKAVSKGGPNKAVVSSGTGGVD